MNIERKRGGGREAERKEGRKEKNTFPSKEYLMRCVSVTSTDSVKTLRYVLELLDIVTKDQ